MGAQIVVLLVAGSEDPAASDVVRHLSTLSEAGLVRGFWSVDIATGQADFPEGQFHDQSGCSEVRLFESIAAVHQPSVVRFVVIATVEDQTIVDELSETAKRIGELIRRFAPLSIPLIEVRAVAPPGLTAPTPLIGTFSPFASANLVVTPVDRGSHLQFAYPVDPSTPRFAANVAIEVASHAGLWQFLESAWIDKEIPGVVDAGDLKVVFAQSQVRVADLPPPMLEEALAAELVYPTPSGVEPAPEPTAAALALADKLFDLADQLHFNDIGAAPDRREKLSILGAIRRISKEFLSYVAGVPAQIGRGVTSDVRHVSASSLGNALGDDRTIDIKFAGEIQDNVATADLPSLEAAISARTLAPLALDQNVWTGFVDDVLSAVDGGVTMRPQRLVGEGSQRLAILDPRAIAQRPSGSVAETVERIESEQIGNQAGTLLGRFAARLKSQVDGAEAAVEVASAEYNEQRERIKRAGRMHLPQWLHMLVSATIAAIVLTVMIPGGLAKRLGITEWSRGTRITLGLIGAALAVLLGAACLAATIEAMKRSRAAALEEWKKEAKAAEDDAIIAAAQALSDAASAGDGSSEAGNPSVDGDAETHVETVDQPVDAAVAAPVQQPQPSTTVAVKRIWSIYVGILLFGGYAAFRWFEATWDAGRFGLVRVGEFIAICTVLLALFYIWVLTHLVDNSAVASAARRSVFSVALAYGTLAAIAGTIDTSGLEKATGLRHDIFWRVFYLELGFLLGLLLAIGVVRTRDRLRFDATRARLQWAVHAAANASAEAQRLRVARSQYLGTAGALARIVWAPFGAPVGRANRRRVAVDVPPLEKFKIGHFDANPSVLPVLHARIRRELAEPGWLRRQYGAAIDAFHTYYSLQTGRDPSSSSRFRPEADRATGVRREGLRWDFAGQLHSGKFDHDLQVAAIEALGDTALKDLLMTDGLLEGSEGSLSEFLGAISGGTPAPLGPEMFKDLPLPMAGDDRAKLDSILWWPTAAKDSLDENFPGEVEDVDAETSDASTKIMSLRIEHSRVFPLHRLPIAATPKAPPVSPESSTEKDNEDEM